MNQTKIIDLAERVFMVLLAAPFLFSFAHYLPTHPYAIAAVLGEILTVILILVRRPGAIAEAPFPIAVGFLGSALPLLIRPGGAVLAPEAITGALMFSGLLLSISAKVFLNRSFGVIAANRGVKIGGPYRLVRHPMYLGFFITQIGFLLSSFTLTTLGIYLVAWLVQLLRIREEEKMLMQDEAYREFARRVPRRVLPGF